MEKIFLEIYDDDNNPIHNGDKLYCIDMVSPSDIRKGDERIFTVYYDRGEFRIKNDIHDISIGMMIYNCRSMKVVNSSDKIKDMSHGEM